MNWTPLDEAYNIHHINPNVYSGIVIYSPVCIYCNFMTSIPLMGNLDGGSFRRCEKCRKEFKAKIINNPVSNFSDSTRHLKGTN
jgi:hypothetical protein